MEEVKCTWFDYEDYFETTCSESYEHEDIEPICPTYCPNCGGKIIKEK